MKKSLFAGLSLLAFSTLATAAPMLITNNNDAALNGSTVIDFNSEALSSFNSKTFNGEVTFSASNSGTLYIENTYTNNYGATGNYLANQYTPGPFTISFTNQVSAFGFSWGAADQPWTLELFNNTNASLGLLNISAQTSPYIGFIGGTNPADSIAYAVLTTLSSYSYDYFLLDNFEYVLAGNDNGNVDVPAPAALFLFATGLFGFASLRKAKKA